MKATQFPRLQAMPDPAQTLQVFFLLAASTVEQLLSIVFLSALMSPLSGRHL